MKCFLAILAIVFATPCLSDEAGDGKKVIEWGWDEPDTKFMRENIRKMEAYPFDGLVFHVTSSKGGNFAWEIWGGRAFHINELRHAIDDLKATPFQRLTDRFLRVNATPGDVDWSDDRAWAVVRDNFGLAARVAAEGGAKGFMFDVEQYDQGLFDYAKQTAHQERPFDEYRAKVRQRGREWIEAVNRPFPDIVILLTFGYQTAQPRGRKARAEGHYALLADFLDGMLEACSARTKIVDAWEYSYAYKERGQFEKAHATIKHKALAWTAAPGQYRRHVEAGFGLWMDCRWRELGWSVDDLSKNYFSPGAFESALRAALEVSDEYVWIYTEQPRWWTGERLPDEYVSALRKARTAPAGHTTSACPPGS